MKRITSLGVWIFCVTLIGSGLFYLIYPEYLTDQLDKYNPSLPGGDIWAYLAGVVMVFAGLSGLIGKFDRIAMFVLGILLLLYGLIIHLPMSLLEVESTGMVVEASLVSRDLMLAGAALMYAHYVAKDKRGPAPGLNLEE